jgi:hypothetical protein
MNEKDYKDCEDYEIFKEVDDIFTNWPNSSIRGLYQPEGKQQQLYFALEKTETDVKQVFIQQIEVKDYLSSKARSGLLKKFVFELYNYCKKHQTELQIQFCHTYALINFCVTRGFRKEDYQTFTVKYSKETDEDQKAHVREKLPSPINNILNKKNTNKPTNGDPLSILSIGRGKKFSELYK